MDLYHGLPVEVPHIYAQLYQQISKLLLWQTALPPQYHRVLSKRVW